MKELVDQPVISVKDLRKSYTVESQTVEALRGVSFEIPAGAVVAVTGSSGAGKSTLLHVLGALERPTSGQVLLNGVDVTNMGDDVASGFRNATVGFVFQMNNLLPEFTALENVMMPGFIAGMPRAAVTGRAKKLLNAVGLSAREQHRPGELSGGEQQRVAIARALLMSPPIILADEPTGNLDKKNSDAVRQLLLELCQAHGVTMLLITHDKELAASLPNHLEMEDGVVVGGGLS